MATTQDYTRTMQDMAGAWPIDTRVFEDAFRKAARLNEEFAGLALEAAGKSAEISGRWTRETLARLAEVTAARADAAEYGRAVADFAAAQAELASENLAALAEVARQVQTETADLMLTAGKALGEEAESAMRKAAEEVSRGAKDKGAKKASTPARAAK